MKPAVKFLVYGASAIALYAGVKMLVATPEPTHPFEEESPAPATPTKVLSGPEGGEDFVVGAPTGMRDPRSADSESRAGELKEVLAHLENSPVYVEGIDGPSAKGAAPKRLEMAPPKKK